MEPESSLQHSQKHPPLPILNQINSCQIFPTGFPKIHKIIVQHKSKFSNYLLLLRFPHQNPACASPLPQNGHMPVH